MRRCLRCEQGFAGEGWRCPRCGHEPVRLEGFPAFAPELAGAGAGFDPSAFAELERLEAASFWFRSRNGLIVWALGRYFPGATSFLEVGCGTGFVLAGLAAARPGLRLTGTEAEPSGLTFAARRAPGATLVQADARQLPFREEFDAAGAFDVLEHIEEDRAVLQALREALRPGGGLLLSVPQHPFLWSEFDVRARHVRRYRAAELREKLLDAGFEIVRMTSFVSLLLPAMWVSRLAARRAGEGYDPLAGLRLAAALDRALGAVAALERALIRAGLSWPFGGSLLAVARRPRGGEGFR